MAANLLEIMHAQSSHVVLQYNVPLHIRDGHTQMIKVRAALLPTQAGYTLGLCTLMQSTSVCAHAILESCIKLSSCLLQVPTSISEVPVSMLNPEAQWTDKQEFQDTLRHLAELYTSNFSKYASGGGFVSKDLAERIVTAGPHLLQNGSK